MTIFGEESRVECGCSDCDPWRYESDYLKYVAEDCETLPELIDTLRQCADYYERRYVAGWRLTEPVQEGMVELRKD